MADEIDSGRNWWGAKCPTRVHIVDDGDEFVPYGPDEWGDLIESEREKWDARTAPTLAPSEPCETCGGSGVMWQTGDYRFKVPTGYVGEKQVPCPLGCPVPGDET